MVRVAIQSDIIQIVLVWACKDRVFFLSITKSFQLEEFLLCNLYLYDSSNVVVPQFS